MKLFVAVLLVASATAGRLDNTYLPPSSASSSGGSGSFLTTPFNLLPSAKVATSFNAPIGTPSVSYGAPSAVSSPSGSYGVPIAAVKAYTGPVSAPVPILKLNNDNNGDGSYNFNYETANHIAAQESGHLKSADNSEVQGSYSYQAPDGQTVSVNYVADENGFRPSGDHLPTPPPVPADILKSLELNAAEEARGIVDDGQYRASAGVGVSQQYGAPLASNQYLPPASQGGYKY